MSTAAYVLALTGRPLEQTGRDLAADLRIQACRLRRRAREIESALDAARDSNRREKTPARTGSLSLRLAASSADNDADSLTEVAR